MDLLKFCSKREHHIQHGINEPFSRGEYTYATDGVVCIRVPRQADVTSEKGPPAEELFTKAEAQPEAWQPIPPFELTQHTCADCGGKGYVRLCNYCKGQGCKRCNNSGAVGCDKEHSSVLEMCEDCYGTGTVKEVGNNIVDGSAGKVRISSIYLDMIKELPNVQISPFDSTSVFRIRFDGGEGLLMPMMLD